MTGGISPFVRTSQGLLSLLSSDPDPGAPEPISRRAADFNTSQSATTIHPPTLGAIATGPSWLALSPKELGKFTWVVAAGAYAEQLAKLLDGKLLSQIAHHVGGAEQLDKIIKDSNSIAPELNKGKLELLQMEADGQSILLATAPSSLFATLIASNCFPLADKTNANRWRPYATDLLARAEKIS
jgi:hypothetical protein